MSSFAYFNNLPVDFIKIDGRFVRELDSPTTDAIVEAINHVGHVMGLRTRICDRHPTLEVKTDHTTRF